MFQGPEPRGSALRLSFEVDLGRAKVGVSPSDNDDARARRSRAYEALRGSYGGMVYARMTVKVYLSTRETVKREEVIRFDVV